MKYNKGKAPKYRSQSMPWKTKADYETNTDPSETVQNDAYTIAELLKRSQTGNVPPIQRMGQYHEDVSHDTDIRIEAPDFDLSDVTEIKLEIEQKQREAKKAQQEKKQLESEAAAISRYNEVEEQKAKAVTPLQPEGTDGKRSEASKVGVKEHTLTT